MAKKRTRTVWCPHCGAPREIACLPRTRLLCRECEEYYRAPDDDGDDETPDALTAPKDSPHSGDSHGGGGDPAPVASNERAKAAGRRGGHATARLRRG